MSQDTSLTFRLPKTLKRFERLSQDKLSVSLTFSFPEALKRIEQMMLEKKMWAKNSLVPAAYRMGPFFAGTFCQIEVERTDCALCLLSVLCSVKPSPHHPHHPLLSKLIMFIQSDYRCRILNYDLIASSSLFVYCVSQHLV